MKNFLCLSIAVAFSFSSCDKDKNSSNNNLTTNSIEGEWKLLYVDSFVIANSFENQFVKWMFNADNHKVTIVNNNTNDNLNTVFESGVYDYQIINQPNPNSCNQTIIINNRDMGCLFVDDNNLKIGNDNFSVTLIH